MMRIGKTIFSLVVVGLFVIGLTSPSLAKNKFEKEVEKEKDAVKLVREIQRGGYDVITAKELKDMIDSGKDVIIIDTMPYEASYKKAHIPGAEQFLFPIPEMKEWNTKETGEKTVDDFKALLGPDMSKTIVIYCGFVKCTRSHNGAMWVKKLGYKNVFRFSGGVFAWKGAKYPIEKVK
ncbi:MAG: rhodanese-like domain-containing protein [Desulfobacterales bacterium]|jgi:thiosulfate/3-mercaptopyruvate sulfurtransferase